MHSYPCPVKCRMQYTCTYISHVSNVHSMTNMASPVRLPFTYSMPQFLTRSVTGVTTGFRDETDISSLLMYVLRCLWWHLFTAISHLQGSRWPLKMVPIGCPETSILNYHYRLRNFPPSVDLRRRLIESACRKAFRLFARLTCQRSSRGGTAHRPSSGSREPSQRAIKCRSASFISL